jgi:hypothetical protein
MGKLKQAAITAQETNDALRMIGQAQSLKTLTNDLMLWIARDTLTEGIVSPDADVRTACAERAQHLINTYLLEVELCK